MTTSSLQQYTKFDHTTGRHIRYVRLTIPNNAGGSPVKRVKDGVFVKSFDEVPDGALTYGENFTNRARNLDDDFINRNPTLDEKFKSTPLQKHPNAMSKAQRVIEESPQQLLQSTETTPALLKLEKPPCERSDSLTSPNLINYIDGDGRMRMWNCEGVNGGRKMGAKEVKEQKRVYMELWRANREAQLQRRKELRQLEMESMRELQEQRRLERQQRCEIEYELWLERKKKISLARKTEMQERIMKAEEERRLRAEKSLKAYETWLNVAKNKFKKENQQSPGMTQQTNC